MPNDIMRREAFRLRHLSETCAQAGDYHTAYQLLKMVVDIEERDVGAEKLELANDFHELGYICMLLNSLNEAQQYLQKALDIRVAHCKPNSETTQQSAELLKQVLSKLSMPKPVTGYGFEAQR